jgi:hypothetical protein
MRYRECLETLGLSQRGPAPVLRCSDRLRWSWATEREVNRQRSAHGSKSGWRSGCGYLHGTLAVLLLIAVLVLALPA